MKIRAIIFAAAMAAAAAAQAEDDLAFTLTNTSTKSVTAFFAPAAGEAEANLLGAALEPGADAAVAIPGGQAQCLRNLRIVFADESVRDRPDVDLCNMDGLLIE